MVALYESLCIAPSTRSVYNSGFKAFQRFCDKHRIPSTPASPETVKFFCADIADKVRYTTLKTYLAGIRFFHLHAGLEDPTDSHIVHYFCLGIKRQQGASKRTRLPITLSVLHVLKYQLHVSSVLPFADKRMLWCAFTLAFYGFLRCGEFVAPGINTHDASQHLTWSDLSCSHSSLQVTIKSSKTDPFCKGCTLSLPATQTSTCPVSAYTKYRQVCTVATPTKPVFVFTSGTFLTRASLTSHLRDLLQKGGIDPASYASHSFRIGAATTAASVQTPEWLIQTLGRWSSDCFKTYIQCPQSTIHSALLNISQHVGVDRSSWNPDKHRTTN